MSNELLAVGFLFSYIIIALIFYKMGKIWLQAFLITSYIITLCITTKFFDFFGFTASAGLVTYAGIFLATDMLTEKYGKAVGFQTVRMSFFVGVVFILMTQMNLFFEPLRFSQEHSDAMSVVYGSTIRVMAAGFFAYLIAQHFDVWIYHRISEMTKGRFLWMRNIGSTIMSQVIDSILFFTLAFYGTMPNNVFVQIIFTGIILKVLIALLDTPFMYLSKRIKPFDVE